MKLSLNLVLDTVKKQGYDAHIHKDSNQVYTSYKHDMNEYPVFIKILKDNNLVQILTFIPCLMTDTSRDDVCRVLHVINKELDAPGFCCDEETKMVFYKLVMPCINQQFDENLFAAYMQTSRNICEMFGVFIQALAMGVMTIDEVFEKMHQKRQYSAK